MAPTMHAAVVTGFGKSLAFQDWPVLAPGPGRTLVKTEACGVWFDVVAHRIAIRGSFVGMRDGMADALAFAAQGKVRAGIELQPLPAANSVLDRLEHGHVPSRDVPEYGEGSA